MRKIYVLLVVLIVSGIFIFNSCKKKEEKEVKPDSVYNKTTVSNGAVSMSIFTDVIADVLSKSDSAAPVKTICPTVTTTPVTPGVYPKTMTIDYGSGGCNNNGVLIKGKITATLYGNVRTQGARIAVAFSSDFKVDTIGIAGTLVLAVTNVTGILTNSIEITLRDSVKNGKLTFPTGDILMSMNLDTKWVLKSTPLDYTDDEITISNCSASCRNRDGLSFTATVTENLLIKASCKEIVTGVIKLETNSIPYPATINFGTGTCDKKASIGTKIVKDVNGQEMTYDYSYEITLP